MIVDDPKLNTPRRFDPSAPQRPSDSAEITRLRSIITAEIKRLIAAGDAEGATSLLDQLESQ